MKEVFAVIGKAPIEGYSKTRLTTDLGERAAQLLYEAFIKDFFYNLNKHIHQRKLYFFATPEEESTREFFCKIFDELGLNYDFSFQAELPFFQRLRSCFQYIIQQEGEVGVHLTGTDIPDFPFSYLQRIEMGTMHIGPDSDGGYYSLSIPSIEWKIFDIKPRDGDLNVLKATTQQAEEMGLKTNLLSEWSDIDYEVDLQRCLKRSPRAIIPNTYSVFKQLSANLTP